MDSKICAKFFFDGVKAVNSGSGYQFYDGLEFLRTKPITVFWTEVVTEYLRLLNELNAEQNEDET